MRLTIIAVVVVAVLVAALVHVLAPASSTRSVHVASEVCEHNGSVVSALQNGSVITVRCSSGIIVLVMAR